MKNKIFLFVLLLGSFMTFAQMSVATLQHGDTISVYYGVGAFDEAHTAATNGDIITLSSGGFDTCRITKAIKLRGAGALPDSNNLIQTGINYLSLSICPNDDSLGHFEMEGIFVQRLVYGRCTSPKFVRCAFGNIAPNNSGITTALIKPQFINCVIKMIENKKCENSVFINSVVWSCSDYPSNFYNCVVNCPPSINKWNVYNSIVTNRGNSGISCNSGVFFHNIIISASFYYGYNCSNRHYRNESSVFEGWRSDFTFEKTYELQDSIANSFRSADGTEVGIHGGSIPFAWTPSYIYVKKCNVANRSTIDGKLSVDIEVITE